MEEKVFTRDYAVQKSIEYLGGDELAGTVFVNKYALKDSEGNIYESDPDMMHQRIAKELARIEAKYPNPIGYQEAYDLISNFKYIVPQGSPMAGIGNDKQIISISNCFVVGNPEGQEDSYGAIFKIDERIAQLQKRRCGVGTSIEGIRPAGVAVNNAAITSTGMIPFAERYSNTTREVAQDGRRGALMISTSIKHPEAEKFIDAKLDSTKITGANISVKIFDDFMEAVLTKQHYKQQWPVTGVAKISQTTDAERLWKKIIHNAWKSAEPGVLFWDKIISESPADIYKRFGFETISTNPCISGNANISTDKGEISMKELHDRINNGEIISVNTFNESTKQLEFKEVTNAILTKENANVIEIESEDGNTLILTPEHKVFTENRGWVEAAQLEITDTILSI